MFLFQSYRLVRERKRVAWILLLLALVFAFCWLPYNTINLLIDTRNVKSSEAVESLANLKQYMLLLGHANSALNPVIYCVMSRNFRRSVKELIFVTRINFLSRRSQRMQVCNLIIITIIIRYLLILNDLFDILKTRKKQIR